MSSVNPCILIHALYSSTALVAFVLPILVKTAPIGEHNCIYWWKMDFSAESCRVPRQENVIKTPSTCNKRYDLCFMYPRYVQGMLRINLPKRLFTFIPVRCDTN